jgi:hypothetical protein
MKKGFLLLFSFIVAVTVHAQHCGWDNSYIIIVDATDNSTGKIADGLSIILADSSGTPYTSESNLRNYQKMSITQPTDTLKFGQNHIGDKKPHDAYEQGPFPFGDGYYMLIVYYNNYPRFNKRGKDWLLISDPKGRYAPQRVRFSSEQIASLCTSQGLWKDGAAVDRYKIAVKMQPNTRKH